MSSLPAFEHASSIDVPDLRVRIDGSPAPQALYGCLVSVEVESAVERATDFRLSLQDEPGDGGYRFLDSDLFTPGREVEVQLGHMGAVLSVGKGRIQVVETDHGPDGLTLCIAGADSSYDVLMARGPAVTYRNKRDSEIARAVAEGANLRANVEPTAEVHPLQTKAAGMSLFAFLRQLAWMNGFEVGLRDRELSFLPKRRDVEPVSTYRFPEEILRFQSEVSVRNTVTSVLVRGWDQRRKREIVGVAGAADTREAGRRSAGRITRELYGEVVRTIADRPVRSTREAEALAEAELERASESLVTGSGELFGDPQLRPGDVIELTGLGERLSGAYRVDRVCHRVADSGYRTTFAVRRSVL